MKQRILRRDSLKLSALLVSIGFLACLPTIGAGNRFFVLGGIGVTAVLLLGDLLLRGDFLLKKQKAVRIISKAIRMTLIDWGIVFLFLAGVISTASSFFLKESIYGLFKLAIYFVCYWNFVILTGIKNWNRYLFFAVMCATAWIIIGAMEQALFGAKSLATWQDPQLSFADRINRVYGTLGNPNLLGAYLLLTWPLFMLNGLRQWKCRKGWLNIFFAAILILLEICLIFQTGSRGAWLALAGQLFLLLIFCGCFVSWRWSLSLGGLALTGVIAFFLKKPNFLHRLLSVFSSHDNSSNSFRMHVWDACLHMFAENAFFGVGVGSKSFYEAYGIYMDSGYRSLGAYNLFLEIAVEMGMLGLMALFFLILSVMYQAYRQIKKHQIEGVCLSICLTGVLLSGLFDIIVLRPQIQILILLYLALLRNLSTPQRLL